MKDKCASLLQEVFYWEHYSSTMKECVFHNFMFSITMWLGDYETVHHLRSTITTDSLL